MITNCRAISFNSVTNLKSIDWSFPQALPQIFSESVLDQSQYKFCAYEKVGLWIQLVMMKIADTDYLFLQF